MYGGGRLKRDPGVVGSIGEGEESVFDPDVEDMGKPLCGGGIGVVRLRVVEFRGVLMQTELQNQNNRI